MRIIPKIVVILTITSIIILLLLFFSLRSVQKGVEHTRAGQCFRHLYHLKWAVRAYASDNPEDTFTIWDVYDSKWYGISGIRLKTDLISCPTVRVRRKQQIVIDPKDKDSFYKLSDHEYIERIYPDMIEDVPIAWDKKGNHESFVNILFFNGIIEKIPYNKSDEVISRAEKYISSREKGNQ